MSSLVSSKGTEDQVFDMWRQALGPKAGATNGYILEASFGFQRMVRFLDLLEETFGVKVSAPVLMQLGTLRALAQAIDTGVWPDPSAMVMLREGDSSDVLLLVSSGNGIVLELCDLAQSIDFPGRIYGLQLPGLAGERNPLTSIVEIADHYKTSILNTTPASRLHIIGYSFGGLVTFELAKMLKSLGHPLGLVGFLDCTIYEKYWPKTVWLKGALQRTKRKWAEMKKKPSFAEALACSLHCIQLALLYVRRRVQRPDTGDPTKSAYYIHRLEPDVQRVRNACIIAGQSYNPRTYDGRIVLFKSKRGDLNACDPFDIWRRKVADLVVVLVPGSHATMIRKPHVEVLAGEVSRCLRSEVT